MSKRIFKYQLAETDTQTLDLPKGAQILSVHAQRNEVCVWAEVDEFYQETEQYAFQIYGTGHKVNHDDSYSFLGTVLLMDERLVLHVFYKKNVS